MGAARTSSSTRLAARMFVRCYVQWHGTDGSSWLGFAGGEIPVIKANQTILKSISIVGVAYGVSAIVDPAANKDDFRQLFDWYRAGSIVPHIGHRFDLEHAADAIRTVGERRAMGKVVITEPTATGY